MTNLLALASGALGGAWGYLAAAGMAAILAASGTGYVVHRMDEATIAQMKLADSEASLTASEAAAGVQKAADGIDLDAAMAEAKAQEKIVRQTVTVTREITVHVPDVRACIPYGLVRVLDAAATGADPASLGVAAGEPDDTCAPLSWRDLAASLADDYGIGRRNAEQLNALEANITSLDRETSIQ
ncbi:MAG: hypothetical protein ACREFW_09180 [Rhizomicrobium sp.]